jgi:FAD/FMN-containing dehydrogenase
MDIERPSTPPRDFVAVENLLEYPELYGHWIEVKRIAKEVRKHYEAGRKFRIYHGSTNSTRPTASKKSKHIVDTSRLNRILRIDNKLRAIVQPNVPMDALLVETLKHGMIPLVVTEFPGITVGGAFSGTAGESSSFKHGYFDSTITDAEVVLANGEFFRCSRTGRTDLFNGISGSLGSIGVVTLLHIQLQRAYKYVEVAYHPFSSAKEAIDKLQTLISERGDDGIDFLDGIMFSATKGAIITGRMVDVNPQNLRVQRFIRPKDPWYFMHVESRIDASPSSPVRELVPLPDYIFRYNRGIFWLGKQTFDLMGIKCSERILKFTHHAFTARMGYARLHQQQVNTTLIQDLAIPFSAAEEFIQWIDHKYDIYPLWLCPLRVPSTPTLHPHHWKDGTKDAKTPNLMLNMGLYDVSGRSYDEWIKQNRELEDKVFDFGGMKWSYATQMYSEEKFWMQHDREWYDGVREKYNASSLPSIYEKTGVNVDEVKKVIDDGQEQGWFERKFGGVIAAARYGRAMIKSFTSGVWRQERSSEWYEWPDPD